MWIKQSFLSFLPYCLLLCQTAVIWSKKKVFYKMCKHQSWVSIIRLKMIHYVGIYMFITCLDQMELTCIYLLPLNHKSSLKNDAMIFSPVFTDS